MSRNIAATLLSLLPRREHISKPIQRFRSTRLFRRSVRDVNLEVNYLGSLRAIVKAIDSADRRFIINITVLATANTAMMDSAL